MAVSTTSINISSCLSILATILLLSSSTATARKLVVVSPFCTYAISYPDNKPLCTQLVNGAKTWPEAMTNAIKGVIGIAYAAKPTFLDGMVAKLPKEKADIESDCRKAFDTYMWGLEEAIKCVPKINNDANCSLNMDSYLSFTYYSCVASLKMNDVSLPEVAQFQHQADNLAYILLAISGKKP